MSEIYKQIKKDIITSLKEKNEGKKLTLRSVDSIVQLRAKEEKKEITDDLMIDVLTKAIKQRQDSIEAFNNGNREDLVQKEQAEQDVLRGYLPKQLSEEEIKKHVKKAIGVTGATSMKDMGKVMGVLMPTVKGKADGKTVSRLVKEALA